MSERVVILGASGQPDRHAYEGFRSLREHGHEAIPVHPTLGEIEDVTVVAELASVRSPVETATLYVRPEIAESVDDELIAIRPGRVLFNPGTKSPALQAKLDAAEIPWAEVCMLVPLDTGGY